MEYLTQPSEGRVVFLEGRTKEKAKLGKPWRAGCHYMTGSVSFPEARKMRFNLVASQIQLNAVFSEGLIWVLC